MQTPSWMEMTGAVLFSGGLVALRLDLTEGEDSGRTSGQILRLFFA